MDINETANTCMRCEKQFKFKSQLERHNNSIRPCKYKNPENMCEYCNKICSTKYTLVRHYLTCKNKDCIKQANNNLIDTSNTAINSSTNNYTILSTINKLLDKVNDISDDKLLNGLVNFLQNLSSIKVDTTQLECYKSKLKDVSKYINLTQNNVIKPDTSFNAMLNSNNSNNTVIANTQNNISTQNTINLPTIINPFGYEDISSIPDNDKLKMLKSYNGVEMAIDRVYTIPENRCFFKSNLNKDNVAILTNNMTVQIKKMKSFMDLLIENGITILERMFISCKKKLSFIEQLLLLTNISANRDMIKNKSNQLAIEGIVETCFQDAVSKEHFKNFTSKLRSDENFKKDVQEQLKAILDNIDRFNADKANQTITDEFLRSTVWSKDEETSKDADSTAHYNNLALHHIETTPRYKFFKEMNQDEITYFKERGISLGNMIAYCKILQQRNRDEIKKIEEDYKNNPINDDNRLVKELTEKLVEAPKLQMLKLLEAVKFIDDNHNKETEAIEYEDSNLDYLVEEFFNEE